MEREKLTNKYMHLYVNRQTLGTSAENCELDAERHLRAKGFNKERQEELMQPEKKPLGEPQLAP